MEGSGAGDARPVVFLGPTLPVEEARRHLAAVFCPPAAQGSVVSAVLRFRPSAILLIDGVFEGEPAVRHKELLWAMARGFPVFGAASLGALRAAELSRQGMIGVGLIFRWYRRFPLLPDDAVAVLHGPRELGSRALTRSLVDLTITVRHAERSGLIDRGTRLVLEGAARSLNFRDRTVAGMVDRAFGGALPLSDRLALADGIRRSFVDQKRDDALRALRLLHDLEAAGMPVPPPAAAFVTTTAFLRDLRHCGIDPA